MGHTIEYWDDDWKIPMINKNTEQTKTQIPEVE
jgi:hypothetical protein